MADKISSVAEQELLSRGSIKKRNADAKKLYDLIVKEVGEDTVKRVQEFCEACSRDLEEAHGE